MLLANEGDLPLPEINRIIIQDMKERVILSCGEGQLQNFVDKEGHYGAAAAPLGIQMRDIGNRHVVGKIQRVEPLWIAVERTGAETDRSEFLPKPVDRYGVTQKHV